MIDPKKSIVLGLAAALMLTTSVSAYAVPDDGTRPVPETTAKPDLAAKGPDTEEAGEDVGALDIDDDEDDDDLEDEDGDDEDDDDVADEDDEDEDGDDDVAEDDGDDDEEEDTAEADDADEDGEDVAEEDGLDEDEDVADADEEIGGPDVVEAGGIFEVVAMTECKTRYCGKLVLSDEAGKVIYSTVNNFDPAFEASLAPHEVTFATVHVGCKLRGYFRVVEGADGEERNGFYVQEFL